MIVVAKLREKEEGDNTSPKPPLITLSHFSLARLEHAAEARQEWTEQNAEEVRAHINAQSIASKLRQILKLLHSKRMAGVMQPDITESIGS
jgi:hypothetical protein